MTSTVVPPCKAVAEWLRVFNAQGTESYTSSVTFTKRLTIVVLSIITYLKNAFPENCFTVETFAGLKLKILKNKCKDDLAQFLCTSLTEAFDALDKKYLHQLALCIYEDSCKQENLIEYHIFEYTYNSEGVAINIHTKNRNNKKQSLKCTFDDVQNQTKKLIRTCIVMMQSCTQELPESADISIRLYYNDDAPEDYQAPGYRCVNSGEDHLEPTLSDAVQLGCVESPYHKIIAKSYARDTIRDSFEANPSSNPPVMSLSQSEDFSGSADRSVSRLSPELQMKCPCSKYEGTAAHENPLLITCHYCNTMQHATCFGLLPEHVSGVKRHCCTSCSDENPDRAPTDVKLMQLTLKKRECLCIFRRTLEWCSQVSVIDGPSLVARFAISLVNARKLLNLLNSYGIIHLEPDSDAIAPSKINVEQLNQQMSKYFQNNEENDLGDHLLAETFASQESKHDQVSDILSPLKDITIQKSSNLVPVIKTSNKDVAMEYSDPILMHYKDAIISGISEEAGIESSPLDEPYKVIETRSVAAKRVTKRKMKEGSEVKVDGKKLRAGLKNKKVKK